MDSIRAIIEMLIKRHISLCGIKKVFERYGTNIPEEVIEQIYADIKGKSMEER